MYVYMFLYIYSLLTITIDDVKERDIVIFPEWNKQYVTVNHRIAKSAIRRANLRVLMYIIMLYI
jgi:hypothetical protein